MDMNIIDATPPAGFPAQVLIMNSAAAAAQGRAFYVRVNDLGGADVVDLGAEMTLPHVAIAKGYQPTHWMDALGGCPSLIPDGLVRVGPPVAALPA